MGACIHAADASCSGECALALINEPEPFTLGRADVRDVVASGSWAYAVTQVGLEVVDISNAAAPVPVASLNLDGGTAVAVSGSHVYVAAGSAGVFVISVAAPRSPTLVGTVDTPGEAHGLFVAGSILWVADGSAGARAFTLTSPGAPAYLGSLETPGDARGVAVHGDVLWVADGRAGVRAVDVSKPSQPAEVGALSLADDALAVAAAGTVAVVGAGEQGLRVLDASNPNAPVEVGSLVFEASAEALDVALDATGTTAFVAGEFFGLIVVDVSNPANPVERKKVDDNGNAIAVSLLGTRAFVAKDDKGLRIIDVANPASASTLGTIDEHFGYSDLVVSSSKAYIADWTWGVRILNVASPSEPAALGHVETGGYARDLDLSGTNVWVSLSSEGFALVDARFAASPTLGQTHDPGGSITGLDISGSRLWITMDYAGDGLEVWDVANPASMRRLYDDSITRKADVAVSGSYAWAVGGSFVESYENGSTIRSLDLENLFYDSERIVLGPQAYVGHENGKMSIVRTSNPSLVVRYSTYSPRLEDNTAFDIFDDLHYANDRVFLALSRGIEMVDVSDETAPRHLAHIETPAPAKGLYVSGNSLCALDGMTGLRVYEIRCP